MDDNKKQPYRTYGVGRSEAAEQLPQRVLNLCEVAHYLHVHRSTAYRMVQSGELPGFKIGSDWRFNLEEIDNWRLNKSRAMVPCKTTFKTPERGVQRMKDQVGTRRAQ